jgi:hypothetical protein
MMVIVWAVIVPALLADALLVWVLYAPAAVRGCALLTAWLMDDAPWRMTLAFPASPIQAECWRSCTRPR